MKRSTVLLVAVVVALLALVSCAPKGTPPTFSTPAPVIIPVPQTSQPPKAVTPEEAAWAKVVEAAKKEGTLTTYSYNFVGDVGINMTRAFKERYGITLEIVTGRGAEFGERLKTEKRIGQMVADMTDGSALFVENMKVEGLTTSLAGELPVLREKDAFFADIFGVDPEYKHLIAFNFSTFTPWINTNLVKPGEEPKVWQDYLLPRWKGKMLLTDPMVSAGPYQYFIPPMREKVIDEEFLKALNKQDIRFTNSMPDEAGLLARGERALSIRGVDIVFARFATEGAPIKAIALNDGTVLSTVTTAAFKGTPHPNAAKVFINWFLSSEGQTVYGKAATVASVRKDVPNFLPVAARVTPARPILLTNEDNEKGAKLFREHYLEKLWGR